MNGFGTKVAIYLFIYLLGLCDTLLVTMLLNQGEN